MKHRDDLRRGVPVGDVIDLPAGSSVIDFAYAIHSDIGDHMSGAKVNGKFMTINTILKNDDRVEIETKKKSKRHLTVPTKICRKKILARYPSMKSLRLFKPLRLLAGSSPFGSTAEKKNQTGRLNLTC